MKLNLGWVFPHRTHTVWLGFYACEIQIRCIECIERHAFWLAKPSGASHIQNSILSTLFCMFCSSGAHHGRKLFDIFTKYITYNALIALGKFYNFRRPLSSHFEFWVMYIGLLFIVAPHTKIHFFNVNLNYDNDICTVCRLLFGCSRSDMLRVVSLWF